MASLGLHPKSIFGPSPAQGCKSILQSGGDQHGVAGSRGPLKDLSGVMKAANFVIVVKECSYFSSDSSHLIHHNPIHHQYSISYTFTICGYGVQVCGCCNLILGG